MPKTGTLRKKGNVYYYRFYVDSEQVEVSTKCTTLREAEKKADKIYQEYINTPPPDPSMSFKAIAEKFLEHEQRRVNEKASRPLSYPSYKEKERIIKGIIIPYFGDADITKITVIDIEEYYANKLENYENNTIRKQAVFINQIFKFARRNRLIDYNPVEDTDKPKYIKSTVAKTWTAEQAADYLKFVRENVKLGNIRAFYELALHLALLGGCRREECSGLRFQNVNIKDGMVEIFLCEAVTTVQNAPHLKDLKNHETRTIYLPKISVPVFSDAIKRHKEAILRYRKENIGDYVCGDELFNLINPNNLTRYHERLLKKRFPSDTRPYIRFHDLRHTIATLLNKEKVDVATISDLLGHKTTAITLDMYIHTDKEAQIETLEITDNIFSL